MLLTYLQATPACGMLLLSHCDELINKIHLKFKAKHITSDSEAFRIISLESFTIRVADGKGVRLSASHFLDSGFDLWQG